jgi:hypothetical protein
MKFYIITALPTILVARVHKGSASRLSLVTHGIVVVKSLFQ